MRVGWIFVIAGLTGQCLAAGSVIGENPPAAEPNEHYILRLNPLVNASSGAIGLILKTRVNGGPVLRLLVDSGAEHLVLSGSAAQKSGLKSGAALDLVGVGAATRAGQITTARVEIGDFVLPSRPIVTVGGRLADGIDGVIPLSAFAEFVIRLDVPHKVMELEPYEAQPAMAGSGDMPVKRRRDLLFLHGRLGDSEGGYLLLDTGSSYNAISEAATRTLRQPRIPAAALPLVAAGGNMDSRMLFGRVVFQVGANEVVLDPVLALDLHEISRRQGIEVYGVIGYPALARSAVTINYRDSLVRFQR